MNADGSDKRQLTNEKFRLLNEPTWTPDGRYIAARKHFTTQRSLGTGEIWLYHVGGGDGVLLVKRASEAAAEGAGRAGLHAGRHRRLLLAQRLARQHLPVRAGFQHQPVRDRALRPRRRRGLHGRHRRRRRGAPHALAGRQEARLRPPRARQVEALREGPAHRARSPSSTTRSTRTCRRPGRSTASIRPWTGRRTRRTVVFWAGGKIRRVDLDGASSVIPFQRQRHAHGDRSAAPAGRRRARHVPDEDAALRLGLAGRPPGRLREPGQALCEGAARRRAAPPHRARRRRAGTLPVLLARRPLDRLRRMDRPGPRPDPHRRRRPAANLRTVTASPGHYRRPRFSPDGKTIVFEKGQGGNLLSDRWSDDPGIYRVAATGGATTRVARATAPTRISAPPTTASIIDRRTTSKAHLISTDLNGEAKRTHATGDLVDRASRSRRRATPSPSATTTPPIVMPLTPGPQDVSSRPRRQGRSRSPGPARAARPISPGPTAASSSTGALGPTLYSAAALAP